MADRNATIWIPSIIGAAVLVLGLVLPSVWSAMPPWMTAGGLVVALVLWCFAVYLAYQRSRGDRPMGGDGGRATVDGDESDATGGDGGEAGLGDGGRGGAAIAKGNRSTAKGGSGGRG